MPEITIETSFNGFSFILSSDSGTHVSDCRNRPISINLIRPEKAESLKMRWDMNAALFHKIRVRDEVRTTKNIIEVLATLLLRAISSSLY